MARTESTMLPLGTSAPEFALNDVTTHRRWTTQSASRPKGLLVMFLCRHCPFVKHLQAALAQLGRDYQNKDIGIAAISSNDASAYLDDAPESLAEQAREAGFTFPYLYDETQQVARAYNAVCTPDFFLFASHHKLVYRGQFDASSPGNEVPITGHDLRAALDALLAGQPIGPDQHPSLGCSIKWK